MLSVFARSILADSIGFKGHLSGLVERGGISHVALSESTSRRAVAQGGDTNGSSRRRYIKRHAGPTPTRTIIPPVERLADNLRARRTLPASG